MGSLANSRLFRKFGIGAEHAQKVFDLYGTTAIEEMEQNPYILIDIARGVDFKQIDKMALDLGISYDNQKRIISGIKYGLIRITNNGHSCVLKEKFNRICNKTIRCNKRKCRRWTNRIKDKRRNSNRKKK